MGEKVALEANRRRTFHCKATPSRCTATAEKYAPAEPPEPRLQQQIPRVITSFVRHSPGFCFYFSLRSFPIKSTVRDPPAREHYGREADSSAGNRNTAGDSQRRVIVRGCECSLDTRCLSLLSVQCCVFMFFFHSAVFMLCLNNVSTGHDSWCVSGRQPKHKPATH